MDENRGKGKGFSKIRSFDYNGKNIDFNMARVMGIVNITPDSFYDGGKHLNWEVGKLEDWEVGELGLLDQVLEAVGKMIDDGAYIIDLGALSTRPGAREISPEEEKARLLPVLKAIRKAYPDLILSIDTYRAEIARAAIQEGADMINDISAGTFDPEMIPYIGSEEIPYILMHIQGTPSTMQKDPVYGDVVNEVYDFLATQCQKLANLGNKKLIVDPGFGFGKTVQHNFELLKNLGRFQETGFPVLAGLSRKSMINRVLGVKPEDALNGTTALNTIALLNGANLLRVHDVKEAAEAIKLVNQLKMDQLNN